MLFTYRRLGLGSIIFFTGVFSFSGLYVYKCLGQGRRGQLTPAQHCSFAPVRTCSPQTISSRRAVAAAAMVDPYPATVRFDAVQDPAPSRIQSFDLETMPAEFQASISLADA